MRFAILTAAFLSSAAGLPTSGPEASTLSKRAAYCTANSIEDRTANTSASAADCLALSSTSLPEQLPESWSPSEDNGYTFDIFHGTCGFRAKFLSANGTLDASQVVISAAQFSSIIDIAIERYANGEGSEGMVGAAGNFICLAAGMVTKVGWVQFEVYGAV
jgi:hypothetical protein